MARSDPALPLRVPAPARRGRGAADEPPDDRPRLRLVVTRGSLGVELDAPFRLGPAVVRELGLRLPGVKFPVELSGGAASFKNRRGELERIEIACGTIELARFVAPSLRGLLDERTPQLLVAAVEEGLLVGVWSGERALAFELVVAPLDGELRLVPTAARGIGLRAPPQAVAAQALALALRPLGTAAGGARVIDGAAAIVCRELLPLAGMRAASTAGVRFAPARAENYGAVVVLRGESEREPEAASERVVRELQLAALCAEAETALVAGELERARTGYLAALERAPRHPEIARRLAELDLCVGGRVEAALGTLTEAMPALEAGLLGGRLLALVGDRDGARAAFTRAAESEPVGVLGAWCWIELARLWPGDDALDRAVARAPGLAEVRWLRLEQRLGRGERRGAREDVEHLEAAAAGPADRAAVLTRAARAMQRHGQREEAAALCERALRYVPDSVAAVGGLARALGELGHGRRALELYDRAAALAARKGEPAHAIVLALGRALVDAADDRPAAIAQVRTIPAGVPASFAARACEARWRGELGDLAGAAAALALLQAEIERALPSLVADGAMPALWGEDAPYASREDACAALAAMLLDGARLHELDRADPLAAQALLALALRLRPHDKAIGRAFRRLAAEVAPAAPEPIDDEAAIERLTEQLRANPDNGEVVARLAGALERLGRDLELLALLSGRLEEAAGDLQRAAPLRERRAHVLERLERAAREAGRDSEADLYAEMRAQP